MFRSGNPALRSDVFTKSYSSDTHEVMTLQGTINKTLICLALVILGAFMVWSQPQTMLPFLPIAAIGGFVVALITVFKPTAAPVTTPIYAFVEGLVLGAISAMFERSYPGIVIQAVFLTFGTCFSLLVIYKSGMIQVTEKFRVGLFAATGAIALFYLISWVMSFFGSGLPLIHSSGTAGIIFSVIVVVIAALNLVLDFDFIERGSQSGAPKYMEWYGAFGLMVTLIWLYMEILRLLSKMRRD